MLIGLTLAHWRECSARTPQHISPPPQNLNFVRVKQALWQLGRGFWHIFQEGPEKFFERSVLLGKKVFGRSLKNVTGSSSQLTERL